MISCTTARSPMLGRAATWETLEPMERYVALAHAKDRSNTHYTPHDILEATTAYSQDSLASNHVSVDFLDEREEFVKSIRQGLVCLFKDGQPLNGGNIRHLDYCTTALAATGVATVDRGAPPRSWQAAVLDA